MRVLVFLHGTAIMHASAVGRPRAERVRQSSRREPSVTDFASYVPTEAAVAKVRAWRRGGADLCYLSSRRGAADARADREVLDGHGFPAGPVFFREPGESYADVARRAGADVVVEDDCESIGRWPRRGWARRSGASWCPSSAVSRTCPTTPGNWPHPDGSGR